LLARLSDEEKDEVLIRVRAVTLSAKNEILKQLPKFEIHKYLRSD
jgi:hypothetical protein